jgi:hypothetical protein
MKLTAMLPMVISGDREGGAFEACRSDRRSRRPPGRKRLQPWVDLLRMLKDKTTAQPMDEVSECSVVSWVHVFVCKMFAKPFFFLETHIFYSVNFIQS